MLGLLDSWIKQNVCMLIEFASEVEFSHAWKRWHWRSWHQIGRAKRLVFQLGCWFNKFFPVMIPCLGKIELKLSVRILIWTLYFAILYKLITCTLCFCHFLPLFFCLCISDLGNVWCLNEWFELMELGWTRRQTWRHTLFGRQDQLQCHHLRMWLAHILAVFTGQIWGIISLLPRILHGFAGHALYTVAYIGVSCPCFAKDMINRNLQRDVVSFNAAMQSCTRHWAKVSAP